MTDPIVISPPDWNAIVAAFNACLDKVELPRGDALAELEKKNK